MKRWVANLTLVGCVMAGIATFSQSTPKPRNEPNPAVVEKLRTLISLRQSIVEANLNAVRNGKGESDGRFEMALGEARLQLAMELGEAAAEIAALNDILKAQQHQLQSAETRRSLGVISGTEVDGFRAEILETEVRILRAQQRTSRLN